MSSPILHTSFTVENTALILVDHQIGTIGWAGELSGDAEREQLRMWLRVITRFAVKGGMPVVLTSSMEDQAQGKLVPELETLAPEAYANRIRRTGVINAWDDPAFAAAVRATGKKNLLMGGLTTDVCLVPPAIAAIREGFNVIALLDISAACTKQAGENSRKLLEKAGAEIMTVTPTITNLLGDYTKPAAAGFFEAMGAEGVYEAFGRGNLR